MFKQISEEHKAKQTQKRQEMKELETKIVTESIHALGDAIFSELNSSSDKIVSNQQEIDQKCKNIRQEWQTFNEELNKWTVLINNLDREIKQIGDVRSWAVHIQGEVETIVDQLSKTQNQSN